MDIGNDVVVVCGLPRSGTSMTMDMLRAAGMPLLFDDSRQPDQDNPNGYFNFERALRLDSDSSWLPDARGKAVKLHTQEVRRLPDTETYRIIFIERDLNETARSYRKYAANRGGTNQDLSRLVPVWAELIGYVHAWADAQSNVQSVTLSYNALLGTPKESAAELAKLLPLLGSDLNVAAMAAVIDSGLYRNRG